MPKAQKPLTTEILGGVLIKRRGPAGWFARLPPEAQVELTEIRERFLAGTIVATRTLLAKSIHSSLKSRGMISVGYLEVNRWLSAA